MEWKYSLIVDMEDLEKLDASDIYPSRINAKEVLMRHKADERIFPFADGTAKLAGGDMRISRTRPKARTNRKE